MDAVALVMQVAKEHHGQQRDWNGGIVACYTPMLICSAMQDLPVLKVEWRTEYKDYYI